MPKLSELTDYVPEQITPSGRLYVSPNMPTSEDGDYFTKPVAPVPELPADNIVERIIKKLAETEVSGGSKIGNKLFGTGGEERYQLWPEKVVRSALTAIPDAYSGKIPMNDVDPETGELVPSQAMTERAMDMATFAGVGGLGGTGAGGTALGAGPSLRPALKYKDRLYKGKEGQQHMDVIPPQLYPEFQKMAMSGEDISHYNFGFVNDKGHFLSREDALKYGIDTGLIDPQAGKFGALTSTLMADSSKPGMAIEALAKTAKEHFGITNNPKEAGYVMPDGSMLDLSGRHYAGGYTKNSNGTWQAKAGDRDWLKDQRNVDHRELDFMDTGGTEGMRQFMNGAGAIRNHPGVGFDTTVIPTDKQLNKLVLNHNRAFKGEPLNVDISNPVTGDSIVSKEFAKANAEEIRTWIKSETSKHPNLFADSSKPGVAIEATAKTAQPFYSAVEHTVNSIPQAKMNGEAWLGTLANKPGVKPEELDWTGLKSFLEENKGKPVTKEQVQEHLAANKVELKEVQKGSVPANAEGSLPAGATSRQLPVHYIDIPQSLKDRAMQKGFPLFSSAFPGYMFKPVDGNPFEDKK